MLKTYTKINDNRKIANEQIYEEVAEETKVPLAIVKDIINTQSVKTKEIILSGFFDSIMYPFLGKIKPSLRKIKASNRAKQMKANGKA